MPHRRAHGRSTSTPEAVRHVGGPHVNGVDRRLSMVHGQSRQTSKPSTCNRARATPARRAAPARSEPDGRAILIGRGDLSTEQLGDRSRPTEHLEVVADELVAQRVAPDRVLGADPDV
jgi:hypothetical protein